MNDDLKSKGKYFANFMDSLSVEQIAEGNKINIETAGKEFEEFKSAYSEGHCYLCKLPLVSYAKNQPCVHWLLKPEGFEKTDIELVAEKFGFFQIQSLLRWYANEESYAQNINSLEDEGTGNKLFEVTICYKNIEWSFSCTESDYTGHANSKHSQHPHYHFQMRINRQAYIIFNDFHLPFSEMDIIEIEARRAKPHKIKQRFSFGEGVDELLESDGLLDTLKALGVEDNESNAPFKLDSFVVADEGKTINGDELSDIVEEAKAKGVPIASLLHKLSNSSTQVIVSPGPGVIEQAPRSGRKRGK